jgi:hypothetical protein
MQTGDFVPHTVVGQFLDLTGVDSVGVPLDDVFADSEQDVLQFNTCFFFFNFFVQVF